MSELAMGWRVFVKVLSPPSHTPSQMLEIVTMNWLATSHIPLTLVFEITSIVFILSLFCLFVQRILLFSFILVGKKNVKCRANMC